MLAFSLTACGGKTNEASNTEIGTVEPSSVALANNEKQNIQSETEEVEIVEETGTSELLEDGSIVVITESGEELVVSENTQKVENSDGSITYTQENGTTITISSSGDATVTTEKPVQNNSSAPTETTAGNNSKPSTSSEDDSSSSESSSEESKTCSHTASDWVVTKEATETAEGTKVKTCTVCGTTLETASIAKVEHTCNYQWETNGNTRTMKCSCGKTKGVTETCYNGYWGYYDSAMTTELFNLCNSARQEAQYVEYDAIGNIVYNGNVKAVSRDGSLDALATSRAVEVLSSWSHEGKDVDSYYNSENLAKGYDTAIDVRCAWTASHSHAATITYQYYTRAGAAWFWYDQDGTGENLIGVAVMEYGE